MTDARETLFAAAPWMLLLVVVLLVVWVWRSSAHNNFAVNLRRLGLDLAVWRLRSRKKTLVSLYIGHRYALHIRPRLRWEASKRAP